MRISKSGHRAKKDTKTLFQPYFKNKTTLVAKHNTHPPTLLPYFHWFPASRRDASLGRNLTPNKGCVRSGDGFSSHLR
ncbi:MAG: hypothetical protein LBF04_00375 [Prevotellaceae bacterium]|jgi:hypothetical protein|nr:hypothetical protein [Prevotellaceae bacterium]